MGIRRRSNVVWIFLNACALARLADASPLEQDDEWSIVERRYFSAELAAWLVEPPDV